MVDFHASRKSEFNSHPMLRKEGSTEVRLWSSHRTKEDAWNGLKTIADELGVKLAKDSDTISSDIWTFAIEENLLATDERMRGKLIESVNMDSDLLESLLNLVEDREYSDWTDEDRLEVIQQYEGDIDSEYEYESGLTPWADGKYMYRTDEEGDRQVLICRKGVISTNWYWTQA